MSCSSVETLQSQLQHPVGNCRSWYRWFGCNVRRKSTNIVAYSKKLQQLRGMDYSLLNMTCCISSGTIYDPSLTDYCNADVQANKADNRNFHPYSRLPCQFRSRRILQGAGKHILQSPFAIWELNIPDKVKRKHWRTCNWLPNQIQGI